MQFDRRVEVALEFDCDGRAESEVGTNTPIAPSRLRGVLKDALGGDLSIGASQGRR